MFRYFQCIYLICSLPLLVSVECTLWFQFADHVHVLFCSWTSSIRFCLFLLLYTTSYFKYTRYTFICYDKEPCKLLGSSLWVSCVSSDFPLKRKLRSKSAFVDPSHLKEEYMYFAEINSEKKLSAKPKYYVFETQFGGEFSQLFFKDWSTATAVQHIFNLVIFSMLTTIFSLFFFEPLELNGINLLCMTCELTCFCI